METSAHLILRTLARHLRVEASVRLFGGAALILGYGARRFTEDADLLLDDAEFQVLVDAGLEQALERTNEELAPRGLYVSHIFGPEQEILTPAWRERCRKVPDVGGTLHVEVLGPLDLITSKLGRADAQDLDDIRYLIERERLLPALVRAAVAEARVPEGLVEVFAESRLRLERLLASAP